MIFDQYSRYKAAANLIDQFKLKPQNTVLDIGSGPECLFGSFIEPISVTYVDPLIKDGSDIRISSDIFSELLDNKTFTVCSAIDVLEHVKQDQRVKFLERLTSLAGEHVILAFPASENRESKLTDDHLNNAYREVYGDDYPWLQEHFDFGLPARGEVELFFKNKGWEVKTFGHGNVDWMKNLLPKIINIWDYEDCQPLVLQMSKEFNRELAEYDFAEPTYRTFVVASRHPITLKLPGQKKDEKGLKTLFSEISERYTDQMLSHLIREKNTLERIKFNSERLKYESERNLVKTVAGLKEKYEAEYEIYQNEVQSHYNHLENEVKIRDNQIAEIMENAAKEIALRDDAVEFFVANQSDASAGSNSIGRLMIIRNSPSLLYWFLRGVISKTFIGSFVRSRRASKERKKKLIPVTKFKNQVRKNNGKLIVVFPIINWEFRWQRPQQLLTRMSKQGYSILYPAMTLSSVGQGPFEERDALEKISLNDLAPGVAQVWLNCCSPKNIYVDAIDGPDLVQISRGLTALLREVEAKDIILLVQFPNWYPVAMELHDKFESKIVFDCMDNHAGFSTNSSEAILNETMLAKEADLVTVSSNSLNEQFSALNSNVALIKNGTEFDHFSSGVSNKIIPRISGETIIGYYGAISDWFDVELIEFCAVREPQWTFILIGATVGSDISRLSRLENVHFLGEISYGELPAFLVDFDVATIPFKINPLTNATNPVKFYEYLSAGKPVVSSNLPELMPYKDHCYLANGPEDFLLKLRLALSEKDIPEKVFERKSLAKANSWDLRGKEFLKHIKMLGK